MTRFALTIEYDGRPFMGWQRQAHGPSVQQTIEDAAHKLTGEPVVVHAAGRTDAGVHGVGMRAHLEIKKPLTAFRLMEALNSLMRPNPVAILDCVPVADDWHARFSCTGRRYEYVIVNRRAPLTLDKGRAWRVIHPLDAGAMHDAAQRLVGRHDFTTFRSVHCQSESPLKSLDRLDVERDGDNVVIHAAARSFLHHQVRSMVGSLKMVGAGRWPERRIADILAARNRADCAALAPPEGLYLAGVGY